MSLVFALGLAIPLVLLLMYMRGLGPVSRQRVERFARRQQLRITPDNGNIVIRYLATTRRWRVSGLVASLVGSLLWTVPRGSLNVNFLILFAGWFVGAVVAEWRITGSRGPRSAAMLAPRRRSEYLARPVRLMTNAVILFTVVLAVAAVVRGHFEGDYYRLVALLLLAAVATVVAAITLVQRQVLTRPQPVAEADVLAADDAIRARSLRVLAGATIALLGYIACPLIALAADAPVTFVLVLGVVAPLIGWLIAIGASPARRSLPMNDGPVEARL